MRGLLKRLRGRLGSALQSDDEFIEEAYQRILGRPVDAKGLEHYRAAFRDGLGRIHFLLELAQSDELTNKLARAARAKSGPRTIHPERYKELVDRTNGQIIPIFEAQTAGDYDWLETRILEDQVLRETGHLDLGVDLENTSLPRCWPRSRPTGHWSWAARQAPLSSACWITVSSPKESTSA